MNSGGRVFVHCFAGVSRSATIVIAYLMKEHGLSFSAAFKFVKNKRCFINPNEGFRRQLVHYQNELEALRKIGCLDFEGVGSTTEKPSAVGSYRLEGSGYVSEALKNFENKNQSF